MTGDDDWRPLPEEGTLRKPTNQHLLNIWNDSAQDGLNAIAWLMNDGAEVLFAYRNVYLATPRGTVLRRLAGTDTFRQSALIMRRLAAEEEA